MPKQAKKTRTPSTALPTIPARYHFTFRDDNRLRNAHAECTRKGKHYLWTRVSQTYKRMLKEELDTTAPRTSYLITNSTPKRLRERYVNHLQPYVRATYNANPGSADCKMLARCMNEVEQETGLHKDNRYGLYSNQWQLLSPFDFIGQITVKNFIIKLNNKKLLHYCEGRYIITATPGTAARPLGDGAGHATAAATAATSVTAAATSATVARPSIETEAERLAVLQQTLAAQAANLEQEKIRLELKRQKFLASAKEIKNKYFQERANLAREEAEIYQAKNKLTAREEAVLLREVAASYREEEISHREAVVSQRETAVSHREADIRSEEDRAFLEGVAASLDDTNDASRPYSLTVF